jgi:hypothetical protein
MLFVSGTGCNLAINSASGFEDFLSLSHFLALKLEAGMPSRKLIKPQRYQSVQWALCLAFLYSGRVDAAHLLLQTTCPDSRSIGSKWAVPHVFLSRIYILTLVFAAQATCFPHYNQTDS